MHLSESKVYTKEEVLNIAKMLVGKTFGELNNYKLKADLYDKGTHGHILEEDVYKYGANSKSAPDFEEAGIELKVTPYKRNKNGTLSAKERLVLNIINYMEEYKTTFYKSHFWYKNKLIEIIWYLHEDNKPKSDFKITHSILFEFPKNDLDIIKSDWEYIIDKIRSGKAHELSEADTMYLGACTKGSDSNSVRKQPFSNILAKQRAFCLKTSYMTQLVRYYIGGEKVEKIIHNSSIEHFSFIDEVKKRIYIHKGMSVNQLCELYDIDSNSKNLNEIIVARMLGVNGRVSQTDEFLKANIVPKTVRVESNGRVIESMSFPTFKFDELINENWENSELYNMFSTTKFMFIIFRNIGNEYVFDSIVFWNMPKVILDNQIRDVWEKTKKVISEGNIVKELKGTKRITNFPGMSENEYCHVRPHGQNSKDTYPLPVADRLTGLTSFTKQCFWLNNNYIKKIVN